MQLNMCMRIITHAISRKELKMSNFWDYSVWGTLNLIALLLGSVLIANLLKKNIRFLRVSLIPTSVLGGVIVLIVIALYRAFTGEPLLDTQFFGGNGRVQAEILTYHCLALGFIATTFKPEGKKFDRKRTIEIFNTGCTTVSTYLLQGTIGLAITLIYALIKPGFFNAAGVLLPFGYGQGTGQAMNYGNIYESQFGFVGGKSFGLTIAAFGFISAAIGGVIYLNILKKKGAYKFDEDPAAETYSSDQIQNGSEVPMNGSIDKMTIQVAMVCLAYILTYLIMYFLGNLMPGMISTVYGFNFLFGVISGTVINSVINALTKKGVIKKVYVNEFLMKRLSAFFFDLMIVAGVAAIQVEVIDGYWFILLLLGIVGAVITYFYNRFVARKLFPDYEDEQFLVMYGMLTGTASTGMILLKEKDKELVTPAAENLVYQNFPAIVFGFPLLLIAPAVPDNPLVMWLVIAGFCIVMNLLLFRSFIFKKRSK